MSKNRSMILSKAYMIELIALILSGAIILGVIISKVMVLIKPVSPPPSVDIQQLELQKAINVIQSPMPN